MSSDDEIREAFLDGFAYGWAFPLCTDPKVRARMYEDWRAARAAGTDPHAPIKDAIDPARSTR